FADSAKAVQFLAGIYQSIQISANVNRFGNGGLDAASDEGQQGTPNASNATSWAIGTINAATVETNIYNTCYNKIRAVNIFLKNIDKTKLTLGPTAPNSREQMKGEARFLRAWYYAMLLKHYGGVPLVGDTTYSYDSQIPYSRSTYDQCVKYILSELDAAGLILQSQGITQTGRQYGRASYGACLALKSRVLLYAASPLFNEGSLPAGETPISLASDVNVKALLGYPTGVGTQAQRWVDARDAALAVINTGAYALWVKTSTNPVRPGLGFRDLFCQRGDQTKEYILQWMLTPGQWGLHLERYWMPPTRGGSDGAFPYQELVDAFPMRDGKQPGDPTSAYPYNPQRPYTNRDPRLDYTVVRDSTVLLERLKVGQRSAVDLSVEKLPSGQYVGQTIDAVFKGTSTGYYVYKMIDTNATSTDAQNGTNRCQSLMRYAEILLNYAEAENEVNGPGASASAPNTASVYGALKALRDRAGILPGTDNLYGLKDGMTKDEMRKAIQLERRLELAFEEHRFWDVRRWKIAPQELRKLFHGMMHRKIGATKVFETFEVNPAHTFETRMYLWPIPQAEIGKAKSMVQNPGY
ncbi:MAG: RagB/SusD family nutrient uptake outer membrane protein, partial [Sphingobacteriaceae bacterium]